jgi:cysteinyl-tRNA synthetase
MRIYDSKLKEKVEFEPLVKNSVHIYVCGPTVYDDAHLGHARSSISFDLLHRYFKTIGYNVKFVKNFTDIDDKIIKKMQSSGESLEEITSRYMQSFNDEMDRLNVLRPTITPKATENIDNMIAFVQKLLDKGYAYKLSDGIYFDTSKDDKYLSLSHKKFDTSENVSRIESEAQKKDEKDFVLWKFSKPHEPKYSAPFGEGRPGWHIECSAMIDRFLDSKKEYQIDIHAGGIDLLFPHHENESAQTRCATGQEIAKYWMHNGFVRVDGEKMSKSLGNSFFLKDALKAYDGEILRFYLLSTHYRADLNFNEIDLLQSKKRLDKLYRLKKRVFGSKASSEKKEVKKALIEAMGDDLNISKALAIVDEFVADSNEALDKNENKAIKKEIVATISFIEGLLGIGYQNPFSYFQIGVDEQKKQKIESLIQIRAEAKKIKDFGKADSIRDEILQMGVKIMDTPLGTFWEIE